MFQHQLSLQAVTGLESVNLSLFSLNKFQDSLYYGRVFDKEFNMMKISRMECVTRPLVATLLSLSLVLLLTSGAQAAGLNCATCHGNDSGTDARPADTPAGSLATYRNITTGAVKGNHSTHVGPTLDANVCSSCHGPAVVSYSTKHAVLNHYSIQVGPGVRYNKYTSAEAFANNTGSLKAFAQTTDPKLGKCSDVSCHFESRTPVWGSDPLATANTTTCNTCHAALPTSNAHDIHVADQGGLNSCSKCHNANYVLSATPFQHATSAGQRPLSMVLSNTYNGATTDKYLPSQSGDRAFGTCETALCHNDGRGNQIDSPLWSANVAKCTVCHLARPITGSHNEHIASPNVGCGTCHSGAVESTTIPTTHGNLLVNVIDGLGYPTSKGMNTPTTNCTTTVTWYLYFFKMNRWMTILTQRRF